MINPIFRRDIKAGTRSASYPLSMTAFNVILGGVTLLNMYSAVKYAGQTGQLYLAGFLNIYLFTVAIEMTMVLFMVPAVSASAISRERENRTYELILTTMMSPPDILFGKLLYIMSYVAMLVASGFPVMALVFVWGGIGVSDIFSISFCIVCTACFAACIGLFFSSICDTTVKATMSAYFFLFMLLFATVGINYIIKSAGNDDVCWFMVTNPLSVFLSMLMETTGQRSPGIMVYLASGGVTGTGGTGFITAGICFQLAASAVLFFAAAGILTPQRTKPLAKTADK